MDNFKVRYISKEEACNLLGFVPAYSTNFLTDGENIEWLEHNDAYPNDDTIWQVYLPTEEVRHRGASNECCWTEWEYRS